MSSSLMKWLLMLLIWFLVSLFAFHSCVKECCQVAEQVEEVSPPPVEEVKRFPIDFQWNNAQVHTNPGYEAVRQGLVDSLTDDNKLVITGRYFASEQAPEGFSSMGMARATAMRDLLAGFIPEDQVILSDLRLNDQESAQENYFQSVDFAWQAAEQEDKAEVIQTASEAIILFPFNSSVKETDPTIDAYLSDVAADLASNPDKQISLVGHTDNVGADDRNMKLSERRAKYVRDILISKGIASNRISVDWKGEQDPISSNDTEEGRRKNRRVDLKISN